MDVARHYIAINPSSRDKFWPFDSFSGPPQAACGERLWVGQTINDPHRQACQLDHGKRVKSDPGTRPSPPIANCIHCRRDLNQLKVLVRFALDFHVSLWI